MKVAVFGKNLKNQLEIEIKRKKIDKLLTTSAIKSFAGLMIIALANVEDLLL